MRRIHSVVLGVGLLFALAVQVAVAQEAPATDAGAAAATPTDKSYHDLRRSKDRATRQWAERYFNLTKLQEWGSAKGTKVKARYVAHAPDLSTVTLARQQGKDVTIAVNLLDKTSQSRVRQIAATQKKLDELIAEGAKTESDQPGETAISEPTPPIVEEPGIESATPGLPPQPDREAAPVEPPRAPVPTVSSTADDGSSDPLGFGELPEIPAAQPPPEAAPGPDGGE